MYYSLFCHRHSLRSTFFLLSSSSRRPWSFSYKLNQCFLSAAHSLVLQFTDNWTAFIFQFALFFAWEITANVFKCRMPFFWMVYIYGMHLRHFSMSQKSCHTIISKESMSTIYFSLCDIFCCCFLASTLIEINDNCKKIPNIIASLQVFQDHLPIFFHVINFVYWCVKNGCATFAANATKKHLTMTTTWRENHNKMP